MTGSTTSLLNLTVLILALSGCAGTSSNSSKAAAMEKCSLTYGPGTRGFDLCLREAEKKGS